MPKTVKGSIKFSRQPKTVWETQNPVLPNGAIGFEVSSDGTAVYGKVGNGETTYTSLPYLSCPNSNAIKITTRNNEPDDKSYWFYIEEVNDENE